MSNKEKLKPIQFIDIAQENDLLKEEIRVAIDEVISANDFINGKAVKVFEKSLADFLGVKHVIGVGNGTDALQIALLALGLQRGDEVILPSFTYFATAEAVAFLGMVPVLVDIDLETFTIDPKCIAKAITPKTKAIVPVHIFGNPCDMESIMRIAKQNDLYVIEDAAQAIGASTKVDGEQKKVSTIGDIGCFSFYPAKNLGAFGDAGAVVTNDDALAKTIRMIANHGQFERYVHDRVGMNSRLDSIQAAVLNVKLKYLTASTTKRKDLAKMYDEAFEGVIGLEIPKVHKNCTHAYHQYTIRVLKNKQEVIRQKLDRIGVPTRKYYPKAIHEQHAAIGRMKIPYNLEQTEKVQEEMISLPFGIHLDKVEIELIVKSVRACF